MRGIFTDGILKRTRVVKAVQALVQIAGIEKFVDKVVVASAVKLVGAGLQNEVRRSLAVVHGRGSGRLDLKLVDRFHRHAEPQRAAFALPHGIGDRQTFDVDLRGVVLRAEHIAGGVSGGGARGDSGQIWVNAVGSRGALPMASGSAV